MFLVSCLSCVFAFLPVVVLIEGLTALVVENKHISMLVFYSAPVIPAAGFVAINFVLCILQLFKLGCPAYLRIAGFAVFWPINFNCVHDERSLLFFSLVQSLG